MSTERRRHQSTERTLFAAELAHCEQALMAAAAAENDEGMCAAVARLGDVAQVNAVPPERLLRRFKELLSRVAQLRKEPPPKGDTQACLISALIHSYYGTRPPARSMRKKTEDS